MIEVFREEQSAQGDQIEAELRELVLAYERIVTTPQEAKRLLGDGYSLPAIKNDERIASGKEDLESYLKELEQFIHDWNTYQGDACYVDGPNGTC